MFNRIALCFALGFQSLITITYAANDLKKWNSEQGQLVRQKAQQKLKTTTYREVDSFQVKDAKVVSPQKINKQIGLNVDNNGSKAGVTIDALKDKNVASTAQKWGKELGKGAVRFTAGAFLVEAGVQAMLDSVDWLLDPANNQIRYKDKNTDCTANSSCPLSQYLFRTTDIGVITVEYKNDSAYATNVCKQQAPAGYSGKATFRKLEYFSAGGFTCVYDNSPNVRVYWGRVANPAYDPAYTEDTNTSPIPESEIIDVLEDYLKDPKTPQNIKDIFHEEAEKPSGKGKIMWSDDPSSAVEIFADDKDLVDDILKSDDPVGEGLTDKVPDITSGTEIEGDSTPKDKTDTNTEPEFITDPTTGEQVPNPNYNPNPNPSNDTGSSFKFELPAFCDYASIVCDWIDWTKEKPDEEEKEEEEDINDRGIFDREFDINFFIPSSCPPDYTFRIDAHKNLTGTFNVSFSWLCMFFGSISYALIFASHCLGAWIFYEIAIKRNNHSV